MNYLDENHIDFINKQISNSAITSKELKEDLIDHFCCLIEDEMRKRKSFKYAYYKMYKKSIE